MDAKAMETPASIDLDVVVGDLNSEAKVTPRALRDIETDDSTFSTWIE